MRAQGDWFTRKNMGARGRLGDDQGAVLPVSLPLLFGLALVLSACGGGGGSGTIASAPGPLPPAPPAAPAPPPPQFPSGQAYPSETPPTFYRTAHAAVTANVTTAETTPGFYKVTALSNVTFVGEIKTGNLEYRGRDNYAFEFNGFGGPSFEPGEKKASTEEFDIFDDSAWDPYFGELQIAREDRGIQLTYSTFGNVKEGLDRRDHGEITFFAVGGETATGSMPRTGSATYSGIADGLWIDGATTRRLYGSTATLAANFATGQVTSTLHLRGLSDPFGLFMKGEATPLGTFSGSGTIAGNSFRGDYTPVSGYSGSYGGLFYGPAANEFGLGFTLRGAENQVVVGAAVGKQ